MDKFDRPSRKGYIINITLSLITIFGIVLFINFVTMTGVIETQAHAQDPYESPPPPSPASSAQPSPRSSAKPTAKPSAQPTVAPTVTPDCSVEKIRADFRKSICEKSKIRYEEEQKKYDEAKATVDKLWPIVKDKDIIGQQIKKIDKHIKAIKQAELEVKFYWDRYDDLVKEVDELGALIAGIYFGTKWWNKALDAEAKLRKLLEENISSDPEKLKELQDREKNIEEVWDEYIKASGIVTVEMNKLYKEWYEKDKKTHEEAKLNYEKCLEGTT